MDAKELVIPHAIVFENPTRYGSRVIRYKHRAGLMADTAVFQKIYNEEEKERIQNQNLYLFNPDHKPEEKPLWALNCVVGSEALERAVRTVGADKYELGYFDVYLSAMLLKMYPNGHNNVALSIAHPPDAIPYLEKMMKNLLGKHTIIRTDGETVRYTVKVVTPFDEPAGGVIRAITNGFREDDFLSAGEEIIHVDIGGKISSITPCVLLPNKSINTLFNYGKVFEIGIQDVERNLEEILRANHPEQFTRQIPQVILDNCIRGRGHVRVQNTLENFEDEYHEAIDPIINAIQSIYINDLGRGLNSRVVFVSGGGGGLLYDELKDTVFEQMCFLADASAHIHLANARGIQYATEQYLQSVQYTTFKPLFKKELAVLVADLGNTQGKGISYVTGTTA